MRTTGVAEIGADVLMRSRLAEREKSVKPKRLIDWPYVIGLLLLPIFLVLIAFLVSWIQGASRWDPAFFTQDYLDQYEAPGSVAIDLERALREADETLLRQLQGTKRAESVPEPRPQLIYALLWEVDGEYFDYLYFDASTYRRLIQHVRMIQGRYVVVPENLYYYMNSGNWLQVISPLAITWWILVLLFTVMTLVYRYMERWRHQRDEMNYRGRQE